MNDSALNLLLESITNLGNRMFAIEAELITYIEKHPKGDDQWTETRLKALELKVSNLEQWFKDGKQVHNADLKMVGKELKFLHSRLRMLEEIQNPMKYNQSLSNELNAESEQIVKVALEEKLND